MGHKGAANIALHYRGHAKAQQHKEQGVEPGGFGRVQVPHAPGKQSQQCGGQLPLAHDQQQGHRQQQKAAGAADLPKQAGGILQQAGDGDDQTVDRVFHRLLMCCQFHYLPPLAGVKPVSTRQSVILAMSVPGLTMA